ncbi:MAG: hypothetical protein JXN64_02115 [Spirochaetes bacterium]|nr:hypothetical protein [Spirochaetota bacterium]
MEIKSKNKITAAKLLPPHTDKTIIARPRLIGKITSADPGPSVILFNAPAGYGKTVLMSQYLNASGKPVIWYQLDAYDDPAAFLKNLIPGISRHFPDLGNILSSSINRSGILKKQLQIISAFFHELSSQAGKELIIALDDYHSISEPSMHTFMEELINCLYPGVQLCIASRTPLPVSLSRFSVEGKLFIIDIQAIRFTREEIISYFGTSIAQEHIIEFIEKQTEGWPVALRLVKNTISDNKTYNFKESEKIHLFNYLAEEVLQNQPDYIQQFLLSTSVLDILTPEYCDSLLNKKGSRDILDFLKKQQLFISPVSDSAYRYHQLFHEFLLNRLGKGDKKHFSRAAKIALQLGNIDKAVEFYNIAGESEKALRLITENGKHSLGRGHWKTVRKWLSSISPERINNEPWLILFQAEVQIYMGNLIDAEYLLKKAGALFEQHGDSPGLSETLSQQARLLRSRGRYSESIKLLDRSLSLIGKARKRFDFSIEKGFTLVLAGKFIEAGNELKEGLKIAEDEGDEYLIANFSEALSNLYFLTGDYSKSMEMYRRAVNISKEPVQTSYYMRDSIALIYREWGKLDRALEQAERSIAVKEKLGLMEVLPYAYYQLACIKTDIGDLGNAENNYRRSINIARETGGEQVFLIMSLAMLSKLLLMQNRFTEAVSSSEEAMNLSKSQSPYVIAFTNEMIAPVLIRTGRAKEAVQMLFEAAGILKQVGAKYPLCIAYGSLAAILFMKNDTIAALEHSRNCLELAARENYQQIFIANFDLFRPVLKSGLEQGIATLFIQLILSRLGQEAIELIKEIASGPFPEARRSIILPLAEMGGFQAKKIIQSLMEDPAHGVKELAGQIACDLGITGLNEHLKSVIPPLRLDMLGSLKIFINGEEATTSNWKTLKSRDLLAYLAHCKEAVSRERILEDLWPGMECKKSSHLFHTTLYYLRQVLYRTCKRRDLILYAGGKYRLKEGTCITDRDRFERLLNSAKNTEESTDTAISYFSEAIGLYRGDYLAEMDYSWLILYREHLELIYLQALKQLNRHYIEKQDYDHALKYLRLLTASDPYSEDVFRMLMECYAAAGNLMMVNEIYQSFSDSLSRELGISPSPETRDLFRQLTEADLIKK